MGKYEKLFEQILSAQSDANIDFDDLCNLLIHVGFEKRTSGSHHIFRKAEIEERVNLQRDGSKAKRYQVKQVREILIAYNLKELL